MGITLAIAATAFTLYPFGGVEGLLHEQNPWQGFHASESILYVGRVQKLKGESCKAWKEAIRKTGATGEIKGDGTEEGGAK